MRPRSRAWTSVWIVALAVVGLAFPTNAQTILIDDFGDGVDDGWTHYDRLSCCGPGLFDASSGGYQLASSGVVPSNHWTLLFSAWGHSADPFYSDGFLRARIRANTWHTAVWLVMRAGNFWASEGYLFYANTDGGRFSIECPTGCMPIRYTGPEVRQFFPNEDWFMEAGAVGDTLSLKVWPVGEPEPDEPQLTVTDATYRTGMFAVGASHVPGLAGQISATVDDVSFTPVDCNNNGVSDLQEVAGGSVLDRDGNNVPDECELGDYNDDGTVDLGDFVSFQACFTGPDQSSRSTLCRARFDHDDDRDVDVLDFHIFVLNLTGLRGDAGSR